MLLSLTFMHLHISILRKLHIKYGIIFVFNIIIIGRCDIDKDGGISACTTFGYVKNYGDT